MLEKPSEQPDCSPNVPNMPLDVPPAPAKKLNRLERILSHKATPWVAAVAVVVTISGLMQEKTDDRFDALQDEISQNEQRSNRIAGLVGREAGVDTDTILGVGLASVEQLPSYGATVSSDQRSVIQNSSVSLLVRPKEGDDNPMPIGWNTYCSGNIIDVEDRRVVVTAASCFDHDKSRLQAPSEKVKTTAYDIGQVATQEFAIMPSTPASMPSSYRPDDILLGRVRNIAVIPSGRTALLGIDTTSQPVLMKGKDALFDTMSALRAQNSDYPSQGQQVALAPRLASKDNSRQEVSGTLLSTIDTGDEDTPNDIFLAVGVQASPPQEDGCGLGAAGVLADGSFAGPVYDRINTNAAAGDVSRMLQLEDIMKLDTSPFAAICKFDYPGAMELSKLVAAFNHPPAPELMAPAS